MALTEGIKRLKSLINPLAKPILVPPFLTGTGVAYNEAKRVTGLGG